MRTEIREINGKEYKVLVAETGKTIQRIHDAHDMGVEVILGIDYSVRPPREDLPEYYEEVILEVE